MYQADGGYDTLIVSHASELTIRQPVSGKYRYTQKMVTDSYANSMSEERKIERTYQLSPSESTRSSLSVDSAADGITQIQMKPSEERRIDRFNQSAFLATLYHAAFPWNRIDLDKLEIRESRRGAGNITINDNAMNEDLRPENALTRILSFNIHPVHSELEGLWSCEEVDVRVKLGCLIANVLSSDDIPVRLYVLFLVVSNH